MAPDASIEASQFHIIQPVVVKYMTRSPARTSQWSWCSLRCCSSTPPVRCTMHFGTPVVPDEYRMYHGWSNGNRSEANGAPRCGATKSSHATVPGAASPATTVAERVGKRGSDLAQALAAVEALAAVGIRRRGEQDHGLDLAEAVEHAFDAEVG